MWHLIMRVWDDGDADVTAKLIQDSLEAGLAVSALGVPAGPRASRAPRGPAETNICLVEADRYVARHNCIVA